MKYFYPGIFWYLLPKNLSMYFNEFICHIDRKNSQILVVFLLYKSPQNVIFNVSCDVFSPYEVQIVHNKDLY